MGWIGSRSELLHTLHMFGVDRDSSDDSSPDEGGSFHVDGQIVSFMGAGEEFVVGDEAVAYIGGKPRNLCNMLAETSYGQKVEVI
jgi:hypothetical protein